MSAEGNASEIIGVAANGINGITEIVANGASVWSLAPDLVGGSRASTVISFDAIAEAKYEFWSDGIAKKTDVSGAWENDGNWQADGDATAFEYEIYFSSLVTSGESSSQVPALNAWNWVAYSGPITVTRNSLGQATLTLDYQIREAANTSNIISGSISLSAQYDTIGGGS